MNASYVSAYLVCNCHLNFSHACVLVSVTFLPSALVLHLEYSHSLRNGWPDGVWFVCLSLQVPLAHWPHVCPVPGCFLVLCVAVLLYLAMIVLLYLFVSFLFPVAYVKRCASAAPCIRFTHHLSCCCFLCHISLCICLWSPPVSGCPAPISVVGTNQIAAPAVLSYRFHVSLVIAFADLFVCFSTHVSVRIHTPFTIV